MSTVLVTARSFRKIPGRHMKLLEESGHRIVLPETDGPFTAEEMLGLVHDVDAIIAGNDRIDESVIAASNKLSIIAKHGTGTDTIAVEAAKAAGIAVLTAPGANAESVAELSVALMLAGLRQLRRHHDIVSGDGWSRILGRELGGCIVCLVGFGKVGQRTAQLLRAFGSEVRVVEPSPDLDRLSRLSCTLMPLEQAADGADVLSLHCPLSPESEGIVDAQIISRLARGAVLVNTARAALVREEAVINALASSQLSCYGTDVFAQEPPKDRGIAKLRETICSPHIGAYTREAVEKTGTAAAQAVLNALPKGC
jgi:D-3-phosphoglycerate dehydrogenase / 2-oxoglutarate reductase